ncbi:hypothetical protein SASPL_117417 [Salvia splendens]|uniref:TF-B3 domain-containing protein n=1 Tax=Salvia splendens TaxID=180675 RepID=A0A8X8XXH3_SALSN|nr:hypothetical protein SASPL_117417 [Salvia splendens]
MVDGWSEFVTDNNILEMKMLCFHIVGNSTLQVAIFGNNSCLELGTELQTEEPVEVREKIEGEYHFLDQRLEIPKECSDATAVGRADKIRLQDWEGEKWTISITDGKKFLNANNLEVGAVLVFDFDMDSNDVIKVEVMERRCLLWLLMEASCKN